jgi:hypothetical protein
LRTPTLLSYSQLAAAIMASLWGTTAFGVYRGMLECVIVIIRTKIAATVDGVAPGAGVLEGAAAGTQSGLVGKRWLLGPDSYGSDLSNYRRYLVNHEFGHVLGKGWVNHHVDWPGPGRQAPLMTQQIKGSGTVGRIPGRQPAMSDFTEAEHRLVRDVLGTGIGRLAAAELIEGSGPMGKSLDWWVTRPAVVQRA